MEEVVDQASRLDIQKEMKKEHRKLTIRRFLKSKMAVSGFVILVVSAVISLAAPLITQHDPLHADPVNRLQGPSAEHIFGTDDFGRDLFARVVYGIQESMKVGLSVTIITAILGTAVGLYSAYYRPLDHILMRIIDGLMAFPSILLAIAIMAVMG